MVSNDLSDAIRKLESIFNKKIEYVIDINTRSFFKSQKDSVSRKFEASDSVNVGSLDGGGKVSIFTWLRNSFFRR